MINDLININGAPYSPHAGSWSNIEQVFMCYYPFLTSSNGRTDVGPTGMGAYYYQGFCCTPDGFAMVRLAPDTVSEKVVSTDISQIIEFYADGRFKRAVGVDVHHGNGMCYYDGYLYVDVGSTVAKVDYNTLSIVEQISIYGSCPAVDRENKCFYTAARSSSSYSLYRYDFTTGEITTTAISQDCPDIYNGSFYKDGVFYGITYNNDFIMIDVKTGRFLGGVNTSSIDTTGIYLYELEDADCAEDGTVYIMSQQPNFTTRVFDVSGTEKRLRNVGFYIGKLYVNGGASVDPNAKKPLRIHRSGIYVKSPATEEDAKNCTLQTGVGDYPFTCLQAASFLSGDVREINFSGYTKMWFGDIYQPSEIPEYVRFYNVGISTDFPLVFKSVKAFFASGSDVSITNYVVNFVFCDVSSVDIIVTNSTGTYCASVLYGKAYLYPHTTTKQYIKASYCTINGYNVIPQGQQVTTEDIRYTSQTASAGDSFTLQIPNVGGTYRRKRICLSNSTMSVMYRINGNNLVEIGSVTSAVNGPIACTYSQSSSASGFTTLSFTAPFDITEVEIF